MAELDIRRTGRGRDVMRREGYYPLFSYSPGELFAARPLSLLRRITEEMERAFSGFTEQREGEVGLWSPAIEIAERDNSLTVSADLPGLKPEDVKVEISEGDLVIRGERRREHEEKGRGYYRSERSFGTFERCIPLPDNAKTEQARADFKNGELTVSIPLDQSQQRRREIPVSATGAKTAETQRK